MAGPRKKSGPCRSWSGDGRGSDSQAHHGPSGKLTEFAAATLTDDRRETQGTQRVEGKLQKVSKRGTWRGETGLVSSSISFFLSSTAACAPSVQMTHQRIVARTNAAQYTTQYQRALCKYTFRCEESKAATGSPSTQCTGKGFDFATHLLPRPHGSASLPRPFCRTCLLYTSDAADDM
eukprot:3935478-Rhodomonas_salina.1